MTTFQRILAPVDDSVYAAAALRVAIDLSRRLAASLTVLHVYQVKVFPILDGMIAPSAEQVHATLTEAQALIDRAVATAGAAGVSGVESHLAEGVAATEIARYARTHGHDLIVLGTHGYTGLRHVLLGSVAEKVVREASCAVLTVRLPAAEAGAA